MSGTVRRATLVVGLALVGPLSSAFGQEVFRPAPDDRVVSRVDQMRSSGRRIAPGQELSGRLTMQDYVLADDETSAQVWQLSARRDTRVTVDLRSEDFDAYLLIRGPGAELSNDDGGGYCNSRITFTPRETGTYRVIVNTIRAGETGIFTLAAAAEPGPTDPRSCSLAVRDGEGDPFAVIANGGVTGETLSLGSDVSGELTAGNSGVYDESFLQVWTLNGREDETVTVELISQNFDSYLYLAGGGLTLSDDDTGGNCNSAITVTFPETATYRLGVSSFYENQEGRFRIRVGETQGSMEPGGCGSGGASSEVREALAALPPPPSGRELEVGADVVGVLSGDDRDLPDHKFVEVWTLAGRAGETVTVELISTDFDTYLWMWGPEFFRGDDDSAGSCNSAITMTFPTTAPHMVGVSSFSESVTGDFRLRVGREPGPQEEGACASPSAARDECIAVLGELSFEDRSVRQGQVARGALSSNDAECGGGSYIQAWALPGEEHQTLTVDLLSTAFDAYLYLVGPGVVEPLSDDDGAGGCNARIEITFPESGDYRVGVSSFSTGASGNFALRVAEDPPRRSSGDCSLVDTEVVGDAWSNLAMGELPTEGRVILPGHEVQGALTSEDSRLSDDSYARAWSMPAEAGQRLTIRLESDDFDPYLGVNGPDLDKPLTDDDGGEGQNSRISVVVPATGTYTVVASTYVPRSTGRFTLSVTIAATIKE